LKPFRLPVKSEIEVKISSDFREIISLPVVEGQVVKKGDLLVKIIHLYTSSLNRTIAGLSGSKAGLDKLKLSLEKLKEKQNIISKGIISKSDWDKSIALKLRKRVKSLLI
jgi:HlyD family secretion protein